MRRLPEGLLEASDEVRPRRVRLAGQCGHVEWSCEVAIDQILRPPKVDVHRDGVAHPAGGQGTAGTRLRVTTTRRHAYSPADHSASEAADHRVDPVSDEGLDARRDLVRELVGSGFPPRIQGRKRVRAFCELELVETLGR